MLGDGYPYDELEELLTVERLVARLLNGTLGQWCDLLFGVGIARLVRVRVRVRVWVRVRVRVRVRAPPPPPGCLGA